MMAPSGLSTLLDLPVPAEEIALTLDLVPMIRSFTDGFLPYSDFNALSLWAWDVNGTTRVSSIAGALVVRFPGYGMTEPCYSLLGNALCDESVRTVSEHSSMAGLSPTLQLVPETVASSLSDVVAAPDVNNHDYVIDVRSLADSSGNEWANHRKRVNRFRAACGTILSVEPLPLRSEAVRSEALSLFDAWSEWRDPNLILWERAALARLLDVACDFGIDSTAIRFDGELIGFEISEAVSQHWAIGHFAKTHPNFRDAARFLDFVTAQRLAQSGVSLWNIEQDLGLQGLRDAKKGLHPLGYLRKFAVAPV